MKYYADERPLSLLQLWAVTRTTVRPWTGTRSTAPAKRPSACEPPSNTTSWGPWNPTLPLIITRMPRTSSSSPRRPALLRGSYRYAHSRTNTFISTVLYVSFRFLFKTVSSFSRWHSDMALYLNIFPYSFII